MPGMPGGAIATNVCRSANATRSPIAARREREQQALGERQARESHLARADGGADRELPLALGDARQHEVGDVHAGDQQEDGHRADEQPGDARGVADPPVAQRLHAPLEPLTDGGMNCQHLRQLRRQHQLRALGCHVRPESCERRHRDCMNGGSGSRGRSCSGSRMSAVSSGISKSGGRTPMIGTRWTRRVRALETQRASDDCRIRADSAGPTAHG